MILPSITPQLVNSLLSHFAPIEHVKILQDAATHGASRTSTSYGTMGGSSLSVPIPAGRAAYVFLIAVTHMQNDTGQNWCRVRIRCVDDAVDGPYNQMTTGSGGFEYQNNVAAWLRTGETGTKEYVIRWRCEAGGDT